MTVTLPYQAPAPSAPPEKCHGTCCGLDALVRPRFFCGQLLTDTDLTELIGWTADKLRLARYRHGWGVVCGLDVRCDPRHEHSSGVIVGPGYAISCCGDDIVVADDYHLDLSNACRREPVPCEDPRPTQTSKVPPARPVEAVDLYVCYCEQDTQPETALAHGVCGEAGTCEHSRTREQFKLNWQHVDDDLDPVNSAVEWEEHYERCLEVLTAYPGRSRPSESQESSRAQPLEAIQRWLLRWIDTHPLHQFCFVRHRICELTDRADVTDVDIAELLFLLVQDCRNAYLTCSCHTCDKSPGVPLARVWLRSEESRSCRVIRIDPYPPYRRPLRSECWPAPTGWVNVGQVIWHRWEDACSRLNDLGVHVVGRVDFEIPDTAAELKTALTCRPFVKCEDEVVVQLYDFNGERRVVGFCGATKPVQPEQHEQRPQSEAADGSPDVAQIKGIGKAYAETLRAAGYGTCGELARTSVADIRPLFRSLVSDSQLSNWIQQAAEIAQR